MLELSIVNQQIAIAGKVLEGETEKAIVGAIVEIVEMPDRFKAILSLKALQYGSQWEKMSDRPDRKITTSDGHFYLLNLPVGDYVLETSLPAGGTQYKKVRNTVKVSATANGKIPTKMIDIVLVPTGIKGTITDADDLKKPVVNAKIQIEDSRENTISDRQGNYRFIGLESSASVPRAINLIVSAAGYQQVSKSLVIKKGEVIAEQNFSLKHK